MHLINDENALCIVIQDSEPAQRKKQIVEAIHASVRWYASAVDKYTADGNCLYTLAQLLEELANTKPHGNK